MDLGFMGPFYESLAIIEHFVWILLIGLIIIGYKLVLYLLFGLLALFGIGVGASAYALTAHMPSTWQTAEVVVPMIVLWWFMGYWWRRTRDREHYPGVRTPLMPWRLPWRRRR